MLTKASVEFLLCSLYQWYTLESSKTIKHITKFYICFSHVNWSFKPNIITIRHIFLQNSILSCNVTLWQDESISYYNTTNVHAHNTYRKKMRQAKTTKLTLQIDTTVNMFI